MLAEQIKELEEKFKKLCDLLNERNKEVAELKRKLNAYKECAEMMIPIKVYTHKARRNTTVKFQDGSSVTVTLKKGEEDCIETAIAYCLLKQCITTAEIKKLVNEREEH